MVSIYDAVTITNIVPMSRGAADFGTESHG